MTTPTQIAGDYALGINDIEIERLGLQHRVWRARMLDLWRSAGLRQGLSALDVGCGPGWASVDLAELVGPKGQVIAVDRAPSFLAHARALAQAHKLAWLDVREGDVSAPLPVDAPVDFAWCRWVLAFVADRAGALRAIADAIKPGGVVAIQEYLDYDAWSLIPRDAAFQRFVTAVSVHWRAEGGEPDTAIELPRLLDAAGFDLVRFQPIVDVVDPKDMLWAWPASFVASGAARMVEVGRLSAADAAAAQTALARTEAAGGRMTTPITAHLIARKR
ncbi:MAG: methyltransferase domain-containing protein [Alphaproteobacteria bacterium]|nr:methyltransferase domain-containing protein [Alphaproteobacteria bacterium]